MESAKVSAALFAKDFERVAAFYSDALGLKRTASDEYHAILDCRGFELTVHQMPKHLAEGVVVREPPERRERGAIRLSFPVESVEQSRKMARSLGGRVDDAPPEWAGRDEDFFLGYDPEGNVFMVSEHV